MSGAARSIQYRPEIDGLRAISVTLVVLFHAGFPIFRGGYIGVDVFYVISGYLITSLLVSEVGSTGTIDLPAFWARRMRRILPAAVTVLCLSFFAAYFILPPLDVAQAASDLVACALYYANWRFAETARNYFAVGTTNVYLNYWSLAIEEQFYAVWPVLIVVLCWSANRRRSGFPVRKAVFHLAAGVFVISFCYCLWLSTRDVAAAFYSTYSRAWELSLGALVAVSRPSLSRTACSCLTLLGIAAILGAAVLIPASMAYPGFVTLIPTIGAAAVITANAAESSNNLLSRLLRTPVFVLIGKLSYSWYLWHWPVFALGKAYLRGDTLLQDALLICLSFCLASATYVLIEKPVRFAIPLIASPRISILFGTALSVVAAAFAVFAQSTFARPVIVLSDGKRFDALDVLDRRGRNYEDGCHLGLLETAYDACHYGDVSSTKKALLFGDSIAAAWFPALQVAAEEQHWKLISRTKSMCTPGVIEELSPQLGRSYDECSSWRNLVLKETAREQPNIIFIASASAPPLRQTGLDDHAAKIAYAGSEKTLIDRLLETTHAKIVILRDVPALGYHPIKCLLAHPKAEQNCTSTLEDAMKRSFFPRGNYDGNPRVRVVDLGPEICPSGQCRAYQRGQIIMHDDVHLTPMFARTISAPFETIFANYLNEGDGRRSATSLDQPVGQPSDR